MDKSKTDICVDIAQHIPPKDIPAYLESLSPGLISQERRQHLAEMLLSPLTINKADTLGYFINCKFNREENSYRSPWSNIFFPSASTHKVFIKEMRELEVKLNHLIKIYAKLYYGEKAITSAFVWEEDQSILSGFNCAVVIKNIIEDENGAESGSLDSIHSLSIKFSKKLAEKEDKEEKRVVYSLSSTMLYEKRFEGMDMGFNGKVLKEKEESRVTEDYMNYSDLCENIGEMVEVMETYLIGQIEELYLKKTRDIVMKMRNNYNDREVLKQQTNTLKSLFSEMDMKEKEKKEKEKKKAKLKE